jgi:Spy/CpxP family protein refolding chaperone
MRKLATIALSMLFCAALLSAQTATPPPRTHTPPDPAKMVARRVSFLTNALSLSETQAQTATTIFTTEATAQSALRAQMKAARQALAAAIKNDSNNSAESNAPINTAVTTAITTASSTISGLTAQMVTARATADATFYQILTPDQQAKLAQLKGRRHGHMAFRRRWAGAGPKSAS